MPNTAFAHSFILNNIEKVFQYWNELVPNRSSVVSHDEQWRKLIPLFEQISFQNAVQILIWDGVINRFIYEVDKRNISGYDAALYLAEDGVDFSMSNMHHAFLDSGLIMQQKIFEYMSTIKEQAEEAIINFEGMYKKSNGDYMHFLQQAVCIEMDNNKTPILMLSYIHDITHLKKNKTSNLVIKSPAEVKWWNFNFDKNCLKAVPSLSKQEKKSYLIWLKEKAVNKLEKNYSSAHSQLINTVEIY